MLTLARKSFHPELKILLQRYCCGRTFKGRDTTTPVSPTQADCDGEAKNWPSANRIQFNFHPDTEVAFNQQINAEFQTFYNYLSMAAYFGRVDVALPGCESFFMQMHDEEHEHAIEFLNYVKMRGGLINLSALQAPSNQDWQCPLHAFRAALQMEITASDQLVAANIVATKHGDLSASDFIVTKFMEDQMNSINILAKFVTVLSGIGDTGLSRYIFDRDLLANHVLPKFNTLRNKDKSHPK